MSMLNDAQLMMADNRNVRDAATWDEGGAPVLNCLWGEPYFDQADGTWKCQSSIGTLTNTPKVKNPPLSQTTTNGTVLTGATGFFNTALTAIKSHPYITAAGLAAIVWLVFMGGHRTVSRKFGR